jgi:hypothetical protein
MEAALKTVCVFNELEVRSSDMSFSIARAASDHFRGRVSGMLPNVVSSGVSPTRRSTTLIERVGAWGRSQSVMVLDRRLEHHVSLPSALCTSTAAAILSHLENAVAYGKTVQSAGHPLVLS